MTVEAMEDAPLAHPKPMAASDGESKVLESNGAPPSPWNVVP